MRGMRALLLVLLMALLPLRGWVGDAMALGIGTLPHAQAAAAPHRGEPASPCHDQAQMPAHADSLEATLAHDHADGGCADCALCQICHGLALAVSVPALPDTERAQPALPQPPARFASAEPRRHTRPPIAS